MATGRDFTAQGTLKAAAAPRGGDNDGRTDGSADDSSGSGGEIGVGGGLLLLDDGKAEALAAALAPEAGGQWRVVGVQGKQQRRRPPPAFTTSTLQQEANRKLKFGAAETMRAAQRLYEVGATATPFLGSCGDIPNCSPPPLPPPSLWSIRSCCGQWHRGLGRSA